MALSRQETTDKIVAIVADVLKADSKSVTGDTSFQSLGADSLDMMELQMKIEEAFEVTIPDDSNMEISTVNQAVDAIMSYQKN